MNHTLKILFGLFILCAVFTACSQKKEAPTESKDWYIDSRDSETMQRTKTDTVAVLYHARKYLDFLKADQPDSAVNMLYTASGDSVVPLSVEAREQMLRMLKSFRVHDYEIERLHMFSETYSELHYTFRYGNDTTQLASMQGLLVPVRVGYYWYLTIPEVNRQVSPGANIE